MIYRCFWLDGGRVTEIETLMIYYQQINHPSCQRSETFESVLEVTQQPHEYLDARVERILLEPADMAYSSEVSLHDLGIHWNTHTTGTYWSSSKTYYVYSWQVCLGLRTNQYYTMASTTFSKLQIHNNFHLDCSSQIFQAFSHAFSYWLYNTYLQTVSQSHFIIISVSTLTYVCHQNRRTGIQWNRETNREAYSEAEDRASSSWVEWLQWELWPSPRTSWSQIHSHSAVPSTPRVDRTSAGRQSPCWQVLGLLPGSARSWGWPQCRPPHGLPSSCLSCVTRPGAPPPLATNNTQYRSIQLNKRTLLWITPEKNKKAVPKQQNSAMLRVIFPIKNYAILLLPASNMMWITCPAPAISYKRVDIVAIWSTIREIVA